MPITIKNKGKIIIDAFDDYLCAQNVIEESQCGH